VKRGRLGLLSRLVAITVITGALVGGAGAWLQWRAAQDALRLEIGERKSALARELAERLDARLGDRATALTTAASRRELVALSPEATDELHAVIAASPLVDELVLYDGEGRAVAAAANRFVADAAEEPPRPDLPVGVGREPVVSVELGEAPMLEVAVAVEDPPGTTVGVLLGRLPMELWASPALRLDPVTDTTRFLVGVGGDIWVHPERDRVVQEQTFPVEALLEREDRIGLVQQDGRNVLVAAAPMVSLDAAVVVAVPEASALAPLDDQIRDLTVVLVAVVAAIVLAISLAGVWLLSPLPSLRAAVRRLGHLERGVRVERVGHGEVAGLTDEFNRLAASLDQRRDELEELRRMSLLVSTAADADAVSSEIVQGITHLLGATGAAFCSLTDGPPDVLRVHGTGVEESTVLEQAATAARLGRTHLEQHGGTLHAAVPVPTLEGRIVGVVVVIGDEGRLDAQQLALAEAYASFAGVALENVQRLELEQQLGTELAEAAEQRRHMLGTVSHEFRTPLTCIEGFSSMLQSDWEQLDDAQRRDLIDRIRKNSIELADLVSDLLDFNVTERGALHAQMQPVSLPSFVDEAIGAMQPMLEGRQVVTDVADLTVDADPVMLQRVLSNLLSNAGKYSPEETPVTVRAVDAGRHVRLEVIDEGPGLTKDEAARAFEPFWRARHPSNRARGTGIGLALVAQYANAMQGAAGVVSEPGYGSTFFVTLLAHGPEDVEDVVPGGADATRSATP
jgi:signal transduction histidine kinase